MAVRLEEHRRLPEGAVGTVGVAVERSSFRQRPLAETHLTRILVAGQGRHRRLGLRKCQSDVAEPGRRFRLVGVEAGQILGLRVGAQKLLGQLVVPRRLLGTILGEQDGGGKDVRARQVERVVGDIQQGDRAPNVVERRGGPATDVVEAGSPPVETYARVRVRHLLGLPESFCEDLLRPAQVAEIGQRVAQVGGEPDLGGEIVRRFLRDLGEAALEQLHRSPWPAAGRVRLPEGGVDVGPCARGDRRQLQAGLEQLDGLAVAPAVSSGQAERDVRARRGHGVPGFQSVRAQAVQLRLGLVRDLGQTELQFGVCDLQLPLVGVADLGPGL